MKRKCPYEKLISPYLDDELPPRKKAKVRQHLAECHACRTLYQNVRRADEQIRNLDAVSVSSGFDRALWQKIEGKRNKGKKRFIRTGFPGWRPVLAGAAAAMLVIGLLFLPSNRRLDRLPADKIMIADNLELLSDYEMVRRLDLLEDWEKFREAPDA